MPKKKKVNVTDLISDIKTAIAPIETVANIPDIITFCEDKRYLGFLERDDPIILKPMQRVILKVFYRGSVGNEHISLTDDEIDLCHKMGLTCPENGNIIDKYNSGHIFRELVLVWGRRSGKDFISSIIALYEAMKLLEVPGGDPRAHYHVAAADINILIIANSQGQAGIAFAEIRQKLFDSEYFKDKYVKDGITSLSISLLTPRDKHENQDFLNKDMGLKTVGSVVVEVGHSNSATLLGKSCFVLILDEVASYKNTGGVSSGDRIYSSLTPSISTYFRRVPLLDDEGRVVLDDDGNEVETAILDGKIISISSPRAKEGKLWELFSNADDMNETLACRLPTWYVVPERTRAVLRKSYQQMGEDDFEMEFGAEFSGIAGENFFSEEHVRKCFRKDLQSRHIGDPRWIYFIHLDPASTSHNYAVALVHKEIYLNRETGRADYIIIVDMLKYWHPTPTTPVVSSDVDKFVIKMKSYFRVGMITYDSWNSIDSRMRLRRAGIPNKETRYNSRYKMVIYAELENLINAGKIWVPDDNPAATLLREELIQLQRKVIPTGYRIGPKMDGDIVHTDDLADALAGACYAAVNIQANVLPTSKLVKTGIVSQDNKVLWRTMQGVALGYGTGKQVSDAYEQRRPWNLFGH